MDLGEERRRGRGEGSLLQNLSSKGEIKLPWPKVRKNKMEFSFTTVASLLSAIKSCCDVFFATYQPPITAGSEKQPVQNVVTLETCLFFNWFP